MNTSFIRRNCFILAILLSPLGVRAVSAQTSPQVAVKQDEKSLVLDNGLVALTFSRQSGQVTSIVARKDGKETVLAQGPEAMYWDCNTEPLQIPAGETGPKKGYSRFDPLKSVELKNTSPDRAEVVVTGGPGKWLKFEVEAHWVLFRGQSGFYSYVVFRHPADQPAARLWQTRFVVKTVPDDTFKTQVVGDERFTNIPKGAVVEKLMDATYRLEDGTIKTKYTNSMYWAETPVYGVVGPNLGLWSVSASSEYYNGGPVKQGQSTHDTALLRVLQSVHFGASPVDVQAGETWSKVYGPFFTYVNFGTDPRGLWDDAKQRQQAEAKKWPYSWVDAPEYVHPRGTVTGRWHLTSGPAKQGARVILAEPGGDWPAQGKKYEFFTKTGADGRFTIPNVIPGTYTLYLSGADQPQDWSRDQIEVKANQVTDLGVLDWKPVQHGRTLWQIGTFDRTAAEFRGGDDARHFEMFKKYPEQFPQDVDFKIGTSDIKKDWNYAQWSWYSKTPVWKIRFPGPAQARGKAYLTLGFASAQPIKGNQTNLEVKVNGQLVDTVHLPKTGTAGYRGSAQDSQYNVRTLVFDAALLHPGENVITLGHADAVPFSELKPDVEFGVGQVMYDAIRLEVGE